VRHALVYVLMNFRKHLRTATEVDPCSSAPWFSGWRASRAAPGIGPPPVAVARTWLVRIGWRRHGLIGGDERPKCPRSSRDAADDTGPAAHQIDNRRTGLLHGHVPGLVP
jgi:hypothetical protein